MTPTDLEVTHHFVDLGGLRMHYVEAGAGPTVVLLHGFPEMWWSWRYQIMPLAEAGLRVIAPDLRGSGETDKQGPYDLDTTSTDVVRLIESLGVGPRARVVGHDWGGALGWHLASTRPEAVERLAVLNCPHPALMRERLLTRPAQLMKSWYMFMFQLPALPEWFLTRDEGAEVVRALRGNSLDRAHFSAEELKPIREAVLRPGAASAMLGWYRAAFKIALLPVDQKKKYPPIDVETLLIWAKDDPALGYDDLVPGTEAWAPRLQVKPIEHCGHYLQAERPDQVNPLLIDFLT